MKLRIEAIHRYFLISVLCVVFFNTPFSTDVFLPKAIRFIPPIFVIALYTLATFKRKIVSLLFFSLFLLCILLILFWAFQGNFIFTNAMLVVFSVLIVFMMSTINLSSYNLGWLSKFWDRFVLISVVSTIMCYIVYNFFGQIGFKSISIGQYSEFNTAFNPLLGAVSIRNLVIYKIGRVSWFTSEPSYLGYLHGLNFFWLYFRRGNYKRWVSNLMLLGSLLALILTFSLGSWLSLILSFLLTLFVMGILFVANHIKANKAFLKKIMLALATFVILLVIFRNPIGNFFEIVNEYYQNIDKYSSLDNRNERISSSLQLWKDTNVFQKVFGIGPGSIENLFSMGESNGWLKITIESGLVFTLAYLWFLFKLMRPKFYNIALFIFVVVSYNSIVVLTAPAVLFYLCLINLNISSDYKESVRFQS